MSETVRCYSWNEETQMLETFESEDSTLLELIREDARTTWREPEEN